MPRRPAAVDLSQSARAAATVRRCGETPKRRNAEASRCHHARAAATSCVGRLRNGGRDRSEPMRAPVVTMSPRRRTIDRRPLPFATCLTIVKSTANAAFNLAMRRPPAYSVPIRCAMDAASLRCGKRIAHGRRRQQASQRRPLQCLERLPTVRRPPSAACRRPRAPRSAAAAHPASRDLCAPRLRQPVPATPVRRFDAVRVA